AQHDAVLDLCQQVGPGGQRRLGTLPRRQRDRATAPASQLKLLEPFREGTPAAGSSVSMVFADEFAHARYAAPVNPWQTAPSVSRLKPCLQVTYWLSLPCQRSSSRFPAPACCSP